MTEAGLLAGADAVLDPGVRAVAGLEELGAVGGGAGSQQLVAPPVDLLEQRQLGSGVGFLAAGEDAQAGGPARELGTVGAFPPQGGEFDATRLTGGAGPSLRGGDRLPGAGAG